MRSPDRVLNSLARHSKDSNYKFERLYRVLFNEEMYYTAYQRIYSKIGNMTAGVDGKTIDGMSISKIEQLIETLKNETYQPNPSRRTYIPKKNGKKRPLGIPSFDDKLLQEVIRMVLESIYESNFESTSHGFRPKKSCHTALIATQKTFTAVKWFIEGDIKGFFDNINHETLINILKERIADDRFIRLIRKFLNAGYIEDWAFHKTYSGSPQGGIISPILSNIYLDKLDKYIRKYSEEFNRGICRRANSAVASLYGRTSRLNRKIKREKDENVKKQLIDEIKAIRKERIKYPATDPMDTNFKRIRYVRYADDFLIGVIGDKEDCKKVKEDIKNYLNDTLKLELSEEKTLITNSIRPAKFLGFDISVRNTNETKKDKYHNPKRNYSNKIVLKVTGEVMKKRLQDYGTIKLNTKSGKEVWDSISRRQMLNNDDLEIISRYNAEIRGFYNYYSIANNSHIINSFYYIMKYSMLKTYGCKYQKSVSKIMNSYARNGVFMIPYKNKKGGMLYRSIYNEGFKRRITPNYTLEDKLPNTTIYTHSRNGLMTRLQAQKCEYCNAEDNLEMHHVRKLKDLKGKTEWETQMIARKRKTLAVCLRCHQKIHSGKLD